MKNIFTFAAAILFVTCLHAQVNYQPPAFADAGRIKKIATNFSLVDKIVKEYAERSHYPAFVYGLVVDGQLVHTGNTGYTNINKKLPASSRSVFRIASMSKSFTAMAILKLRDEGKLNLDDPASKYIPQMKKLRGLTSDASAITIRHLLSHAAGFPEDNPWGDRQLADTDAELMKLVEDGISFSNVPGVAYEYSNLGFALLGRIVTNVSKKPYQQYITENILRPLGMNNTYWEYTKVPADQLAHGYRWINGAWREEELLHDGAYGAMGGLMTTIEDFSKYMALHQSAWPPRNDNDNGPVKRSSLREMQRPWNFNALILDFKYPDGRVCPIASAYCYGLGWIKDCEDRVMVGHSGGLPGFGSQWRILPEYGIGIVSFANLTYAGTGTINLQVLDTIISLAGLQPRSLPPSNILNQRKNELVQLLPGWNNAEKNKIFAENFFLDYPIDSLRKEAASIFSKAGKITSIGEMKPLNQMRGNFIMNGEKEKVNVFFTLTPENPGLIQEYHINLVPR